MKTTMILCCLCAIAIAYGGKTFSDSFETVGENEIQVAGLKGKALKTGLTADGKKLTRQMLNKGYLNNRQGTVAFWLSPLDWDAGTPEMQVFFSARGDDGALQIYKYIDVGNNSAYSNKLLFLYGNPLQNEGGEQQWRMIAPVAKNSFRRGDWYHLAATWDQDTVKLFVNGKPVASGPVNKQPVKPFKQITLGHIPEKSASTAMDELEIYDSALSESEIFTLYESGRPVKLSALGPVTIGKIAKAPRLDGRIEAGEYSFTATGMLEIGNNARYAADQSTVYAAYDDHKLYLAIKTPADKLQANGTDATICHDDALEFYVAPRNRRNQLHHWIINSVGSVYYALNQNSLAKFEGFEFKSRVADNVWIMELSIPYSSLQTPPPSSGEVWGLNICRTFTSPGVTYTSFGVSIGSYAAGVFPVTLRDGIEPYGFEVTGNPNAGSFAVKTISTAEMRLNANTGIDVEPNRELKDFGDTGDLMISFKSGEDVLFKADYQFFPQPKGTYRFQYLYTDIAGKTVNVGNYQPEPMVGGKPVLGRLFMTDEHGDVIAETAFAGKTCDYENALSIRDIEPGDYQLNIELKDHYGKLLWTWNTPYRIYPDGPAPWEGNRIGREDIVLAPWTPVRVEGRTVKVWGRDYVYEADSLFPAQIVSQGRPLLKSPILLTSGGDKAIATHVAVTDISPSACTVTASGTLGPLSVKTHSRIEYDGFVWITLELNSEKDAVLNRLQLEIPFRPEMALLRNFGDYKLQRTGAMPKEPCTKDMLAESPLFWVGGNDAGLQWLAEGLKNWRLKDPARSLVITPGGDRTLATVNIFDAPVTVKGSRAIEFGLEATPIRPVDLSGREIRMWTTARLNFNELYKYYSYPDAGLLNPPVYKELLRLKNRKTKVSPYMALGAASPLSLEYKYYGDIWRITPPPDGWDRIRPQRVDLPGVATNTLWMHYLVCPRSQSYQDFYLEKLLKTIDELDLDGYYFDWADVRKCDNSLHGCGWTDWNGVRRPSYNFRGIRDFGKRFRTAVKPARPDFMIWFHMSGVPVMPAHGFCDFLVEGENFASGVGMQESYYNLLPLDKARAGYTSGQWGPQIFFEAQFTRVAELYNPARMAYYRTPEARPVLKHITGMLMLHDSLIHSLFGIDQTEEFVALEPFGWNRDAVFIPYWNNAKHLEILSPVNDNVVISVFDKPDRFLLLPFNNTDQAQTLKVRLDNKTLSAAKLIDLKTKEEFPLHHQTVEFTMEPRAFRLLMGIRQ